MRTPRRALVLLVAGLAAPAPGAEIYFAEIAPGFGDGSIRRMNTDGTGLVTLIPVGGGLRSLDLDLEARKVYWTDVNNFVIRRANLDGSGVEDVITSGLVFPSAIVLHPPSGAMFWLDQVENQLLTAGLDGSDPHPIRDTAAHRGIAIDPVAAKVYWSTSISDRRGQIHRANLDGTGHEIVVSSPDPEFKPSAIAIDPAGGKIYWTDYVVDIVQRSNLDGTDIELLYAVGANFNPRGIALDLEAGKVYWGQDIDFEGSGGRILRMNLDGSEQEVFLDGIGLPNYLAIRPDAPDCRVDFNGDGFVDTLDVLAFLAAFAAGDPSADFDGNGIVDTLDVLDFLNAFGEGCE